MDFTGTAILAARPSKLLAYLQSNPSQKAYRDSACATFSAAWSVPYWKACIGGKHTETIWKWTPKDGWHTL